MSDRADRGGDVVPALLSVTELANLLAVSSSLLAKWRMSGRGPRYMKIGRRILYDVEDVARWLGTQKRSST